MRVHVVDPPLFTLPYDQHFCRALTAAGAEVTLVGRGLRAYEELGPEPFAFAPLFYKRSENAATGWRTSRARQVLKGVEHLQGLRELGRLAARDRPDIVHLQWFVLPFFDRFLFRRLGRDAGLVLTVHDSLSLHGARNASPLQLLGDREARLLFDHFIVHTEQTRSHLGELGVADGKITVLPHPPLRLVTTQETAPAPQAGPPQILFFGSIKGYKGVDVLVEAGLKLAAEGRDFVIKIAGRPFEPLDALEARIAAAGAGRHFRFDLRFIPDDELAAYVRSADLVVFPYRRIDASGALGRRDRGRQAGGRQRDRGLRGGADAAASAAGPSGRSDGPGPGPGRADRRPGRQGVAGGRNAGPQGRAALLAGLRASLPSGLRAGAPSSGVTRPRRLAALRR